MRHMNIWQRWAGVLGRLRGTRLGGYGSARPDDLATQQALRDSEERLRLVRRATGLGMYEIDWVARRRYWSPELRTLLRVPDDFDINSDSDLLERIIADDMISDFRAKLRASLAPESGGDYEDEHRIRRFDGSVGWILLRGKTFFAEGPNGPRATRSIGLVVDITDRKRAEEANALHASTVQSSNDAIFSIDPNRVIRTWNPGAERLYGYTAAEMIGRPITDLSPENLHDEQFSLYRETQRGHPVVIETMRRHKDGRLVPVGISAAPILDGEGRIAGVAAVHRDMTENRQYGDHLAFTLRELSHRTKNVLAVVQGLGHMIARRSETIEDFQTRFNGCIQALAHTHDLLVQHDWQSVTLAELLLAQLAPFGGIDGCRFIATGPEVHLRPSAMQSLGLIIHELATNAARHGALSADCGAVSIGWDVDSAGVRLTWQENGGPAVTPPPRKGFGQIMFDRIGASLDGHVALDYRTEGLRCVNHIGAGNLCGPSDHRKGSPVPSTPIPE
jgi:PAS domain S-box-containing protein